jgi:hypothetical protein
MVFTSGSSAKIGSSSQSATFKPFSSMGGASVGMGASARCVFEMLRAPAKIARAMGAKPLSWAQGVLAHTARHREWLQANATRTQMADAMESFFAPASICAPGLTVGEYPFYLNQQVRGEDHNPCNECERAGKQHEVDDEFGHGTLPIHRPPLAPRA